MIIDKKLQELRDRIDIIDSQILDLINARANCVKAVGVHKLSTGEDAIFYRPEREIAQMKKLGENNKGPLSNEHVQSVFREIISACFALEHKIKVVFLGPDGTFTHAAAVKTLGSSTDFVSLDSITAVFRAIAFKQADYGVVPVESSIEGAVNETLDSFVNSDVKICGEVEIPIEFCLIAKDQYKLSDLEVVYAHPHAYAQCSKWIKNNLPHRIPILGANSNAAAVKQSLDDQEKITAALAGKITAKEYSMQVLDSPVNDYPNGITRFLVIGRHTPAPAANNKTSLLVFAANKQGALYKILEPFERLKINLIRLESRPIKQTPWSYIFYIDLCGHIEQQHIKEAIAEISAMGNQVQNLGSYPVNLS